MGIVMGNRLLNNMVSKKVDIGLAPLYSSFSLYGEEKKVVVITTPPVAQRASALLKHVLYSSFIQATHS